MSSSVDVRGALSLLAEIEPGLSDAERALRAAEPELSPADVLDRALRQALAALHVEVSPQTFVYLRWRIEHGRGVPDAGTTARDRRRPIHR
jgi:hypothetical protein